MVVSTRRDEANRTRTYGSIVSTEAHEENVSKNMTVEKRRARVERDDVVIRLGGNVEDTTVTAGRPVRPTGGQYASVRLRDVTKRCFEKSSLAAPPPLNSLGSETIGFRTYRNTETLRSAS